MKTTRQNLFVLLIFLRHACFKNGGRAGNARDDGRSDGDGHGHGRRKGVPDGVGVGGEVAGGVAGGPPHHRPLRRQAAHPSLARSLSSRVRPARRRRRRRATAMEKNRNVDVVGGRVGLGFGRTQVLRACPFMVEGRVVGT